MKDLISVIVPVYNVEKYLDKCVQSIVDQTYTNLEIILVDDGSPDSCPQMCDEWAKKDSRIKVIHKENCGVSSARNTGLDVAKGEYIGFVDADDWIDLNTYEVACTVIKETNTDLVNYGFYICEQDDFIENNINVTPQVKVYNQKDYMNIMITPNQHTNKHFISSTIWNKLFKKILIDNLRFDSEIVMSEDQLFTLDYVKNTQTISNVFMKYYFYRKRNDSAVKTFTNKNIGNVKAYEKIINSDGLTEETLVYLKNLILIFSSRYIIESRYNCLLDDYCNLNYAKDIMKKYYPEFKNSKHLTFKKKLMILFSRYFPDFYVGIKKVLKRGK